MSLCIRINTREKGTIETLLEKIHICEVLDAIGAQIIQYLKFVHQVELNLQFRRICPLMCNDYSVLFRPVSNIDCREYSVSKDAE